MKREKGSALAGLKTLQVFHLQLFIKIYNFLGFLLISYKENNNLKKTFRKGKRNKKILQLSLNLIMN